MRVFFRASPVPVCVCVNDVISGLDYEQCLKQRIAIYIHMYRCMMLYPLPPFEYHVIMQIKFYLWANVQYNFVWHDYCCFIH